MEQESYLIFLATQEFPLFAPKIPLKEVCWNDWFEYVLMIPSFLLIFRLPPILSPLIKSNGDTGLTQSEWRPNYRGPSALNDSKWSFFWFSIICIRIRESEFTFRAKKISGALVEKYGHTVFITGQQVETDCIVVIALHCSITVLHLDEAMVAE